MPTATKTPISAKRSAAARKNGANSKGPKSAQGKARSSQNALKHGLSAAKWLALPEDEEGASETFSDELLEEMAPRGAMQRAYAGQIVDNLWRLRRVMTMETDLVSHEENPKRNRTYEYTRYDWPQAHAALARYESSLHRNLEKARKTLKELQNEPKPSGAPSRSSDDRADDSGRGLGEGYARTQPSERTTEFQLDLDLDLDEGEYIRGLVDLPEVDSQNEPKTDSGAPSSCDPRNEERRRKGLGMEVQTPNRQAEGSASEPFLSKTANCNLPTANSQTIETNTIELPIRSLEEQREYELIQDYLETHPADTIFEAQKALYPKKYTQR